VRLVNGSGTSSGRLEIYHQGVWGTVCDDSFTNTNATVVCRMLGYTSGTYECCAASGSGTGQIWLDDVSCTGSESSIVDCTHAPWGTNNCSHGEDVSITCSP
jgi:deleted-in-malignant-brain-tumors protein 1